MLRTFKVAFFCFAVVSARAYANVESPTAVPPADPAAAAPVANAVTVSGPASVVVASLDPVTREDRVKALKENLASLDEQLQTLKTSMKTKSRAYMELSQAQARPLFMWQDETDVGAKKQYLLKIAALDLKQLVKKIELFQTRREEVSFELEWLGMDLQKDLTLSKAKEPAVEKHSKKSLVSPIRKTAFACNAMPVEALDGEKAQIVQGFGETKDPESGIKWQSSGWWVQRLKAEVHACAAGKVAFSGKIPGRGSVVLVDHGQGVISLYANLLDNDLPQRGTKVEAGTVLGMLRDKFYFEIRRDGQAVDPKSTFAPDRLAKFAAE